MEGYGSLSCQENVILPMTMPRYRGRGECVQQETYRASHKRRRYDNGMVVKSMRSDPRLSSGRETDSSLVIRCSYWLRVVMTTHSS